MFHLNVNPSPSSLAGFVTPGHDVDSSAIIMALGFLWFIMLLRCLKNSIASRFPFPPYLFGTQLPGVFP